MIKPMEIAFVASLKQTRYLLVFFKQVNSTILICLYVFNQYFYFIKAYLKMKISLIFI